MRWAVLQAMGLGMAGAVMLAACGEAARAPERSPGAPPATALASSPSSLPRGPTLTVEEETRAEEIVATDPRAQQIIGGRPYAVEDVAVWTTGLAGPNWRKIGAVLDLSWDEPVSIESDWPALRYQPFPDYWPPATELLPYDELTVHYTAHGVGGLTVHVDLNRGRVVAIEPSPHSEIEPSPSLNPQLTPQEETKAKQIFAADPRLQELLGGRDHSTGPPFGAWGVNGRKIAFAFVSFPERVPIAFDWPLVDFEDGEVAPSAWREFTVHFAAPTVGQLTVLIDLYAEKVVAIEPAVGD